MRWLFAIPGAAALFWGAWQLVEFLLDSKDWLDVGFWLVGGPIVHDALVAPIVAVVGLLLSRVVPNSWRTPVIAGTVVSAVLVLLAVPLLWRRFPAATNPGLHDRDYGLALLISLAVVWLGVLAVGLLRMARSAKR